AAQALPEYLRPTVWSLLEVMPFNTAGKIDRRALPEPEFAAGEYAEPRTDVERAVAAVFGDVLGVDTVSATDSFFDLGGNSLSATRVAARIAETLGIRVGVRDLFDAPTVRALAALVADVTGPAT
ncbi:hypothetical protein G3I15_11735, partial [Streptomyces sp. SID10244]|nr:hypothetical protein [Streptomyces sp. SID10244]